MGTSIKDIWKKIKVLGKDYLILVIVGLMHGFERLVEAMDRIAGHIEEDVIMQIGKTSFEPENAQYLRFVSKEEIDRLYADARVVVCHAGVGSILTALEHNKPVIAVPRREKYGEHLDDHQIEIAREMEKERWITVVYDMEELEEVIKKIFNASRIKPDNKNILVNKLKAYVNGLDQKLPANSK